MSLEKIPVPVERLRELFNQHYEARLVRGDLELAERRSAPAPAGLGKGTQSVIYDVYDSRQSAHGSAVKVAIVHAYVRADGSLAASGRYDPKAVWVGGILYVAGGP